MNALTKPCEFEPAAANFSGRESAIPLPLIATQALFTAEDAVRSSPPRREPWADEPWKERPVTPWYRRLGGAIGRLLEPRPPRYPLTEHLCRDIGLEWRAEPPVRTWPW